MRFNESDNAVTISVVDREEFRQIVEQARVTVGETVTAEPAEAVAQQLVTRLTELGPAAAVEFQLVYDTLNREAYRWDLWAAAYLMRAAALTTGSTTSAAG